MKKPTLADAMAAAVEPDTTAAKGHHPRGATSALG